MTFPFGHRANWSFLLTFLTNSFAGWSFKFLHFPEFICFVFVLHCIKIFLRCFIISVLGTGALFQKFPHLEILFVSRCSKITPNMYPPIFFFPSCLLYNFSCASYSFLAFNSKNYYLYKSSSNFYLCCFATFLFCIHASQFSFHFNVFTEIPTEIASKENAKAAKSDAKVMRQSIIRHQHIYIRKTRNFLSKKFEQHLLWGCLIRNRLHWLSFL